jgi:hypothetical protein
VILELVSVGVDLDVLHLGAVLAQVFVEGDETRPVRLNELDPSQHALLLVFESSLTLLLATKMMDWACRQTSISTGMAPGRFHQRHPQITGLAEDRIAELLPATVRTEDPLASGDGR